MKKKIVLTAAVVIFALLLCGCFFKSGDELYRLPKAPEDYYDLQSALDAMLDSGAEYSAPVSGSNQQAVQLLDIDTDGQEEAIAFFKVGGENPLRVCIYKKDGESYTEVAAIEGGGTAIESVEYVQLDGGGSMEIILCWQMSDEVMQAITAYSLVNFDVTSMLVSRFTEYRTADLDSDGASEILLFRHDSAEMTGVVEYYRNLGGAMELAGQADMTQGIETIKRIIAGRIEGNIPGVYLAGVYQNTGIVTDIYALKDGEFTNIALMEATDAGETTARWYSVYAEDIDGDGCLEIPRPVQLPAHSSEGETGSFWVIRWHDYFIDGLGDIACTTYHNYTDGWYFILPEEWDGRVSIHRDDSVSGERALIFCRADDPSEDVALTIYTLSGEKRLERAHQEGRFMLESGDPDSGTVCAARLGTADWEYAVSEQEVYGGFRLIRTEWNTGEIY